MSRNGSEAFWKAMIEDNGLWAPKMALASIDASPTQRLGAVWRPKIAAKGASRAKENLHLDTCFMSRSGSQAFWKGYN